MSSTAALAAPGPADDVLLNMEFDDDDDVFVQALLVPEDDVEPLETDPSAPLLQGCTAQVPASDRQHGHAALCLLSAAQQHASRQLTNGTSDRRQKNRYHQKQFRQRRKVRCCRVTQRIELRSDLQIVTLPATRLLELHVCLPIVLHPIAN